jgi:hypothetical protein
LRRAWVLVWLLATAIHLTTLARAPNIHQDETQIIDMGRVLLDPATTWSVNLSASGQPLPSVPAWLGSVLQELAFRWSVPSPLGPRISSMVGAVLAATLLRGWLLARGTPGLAAFLLAASFYIDPLFIGSYRSGRVDSWSLAVLLGACLLLRSGIPSPRRMFAAGTLAATLLFVWPSVLLLAPLLLLELWTALRSSAEEATKRLAWFATGAAAFAVLLAAPIVPLLAGGETPRAIWAGSLVARTHWSWESLSSNLNALAQTAKMSPATLLGFAAGLVTRGARRTLAVSALPFGVVLATWAYPMRQVYLLPYGYGLLGAAACAWGRSPRAARRASAALAALACWSAFWTLVVYPATALSWKMGKDTADLTAAGRSHIGSGPHRVYLDTESLAFYHAGRGLGWSIFHSYVEEAANPAYYAALHKLLPGVDFAIFRAATDSRSRQLLEEAGLRFQAHMLDYAIDRRYPYRFALGHPPYGPFALYVRSPRAGPAAERAPGDPKLSTESTTKGGR